MDVLNCGWTQVTSVRVGGCFCGYKLLWNRQIVSEARRKIIISYVLNKHFCSTIFNSIILE